MELQNIHDFQNNIWLQKKPSKIIVRSCNKREIKKLSGMGGRVDEYPLFDRLGKHIGYDFVFYNTGEIVKYMEKKNANIKAE